MKIVKVLVITFALITVNLPPKEAHSSETVIPTIISTVAPTVAPSILQTFQTYWNIVSPIALAGLGLAYVNRQKFFDCFAGIRNACCPPRNIITPPDPVDELKSFLDSNLPHNVYALIEESYVLLRKGCKKENTKEYENLGFSFIFPEEKIKYAFRKFSIDEDKFTEEHFASQLTKETVEYLRLKLKNGAIPETFIEEALQLYNKGSIKFVPFNEGQDFYFVAGWEKGVEPKNQKSAFIICVDQNYNFESVLDIIDSKRKSGYGTFKSQHLSINKDDNIETLDLNSSKNKEDTVIHFDTSNTKKPNDKSNLLDEKN